MQLTWHAATGQTDKSARNIRCWKSPQVVPSGFAHRVAMQGLAAIGPIDLGQAYMLHRLSAAGLSVTYVVLYVMASFCLATGTFHPETSPDGQRHQHEHHHHEPSSSAAVAPDLCDFALQVLSTPLWHPAPALPIVVLPNQTPIPVDVPCTLFYIAVVNTIRAPPERMLDVA